MMGASSPALVPLAAAVSVATVGGGGRARG